MGSYKLISLFGYGDQSHTPSPVSCRKIGKLHSENVGIAARRAANKPCEGNEGERKRKAPRYNGGAASRFLVELPQKADPWKPQDQSTRIGAEKGFLKQWGTAFLIKSLYYSIA